MVFILDENENLMVEINRAVDNANVRDMIVAPTIPSYNKILKLLKERKPDTLIYVRLASAVYFPMIGIELYYGPDDEPVVDVQPPDDSKFV
jgi:hypothetical protein